MRFADLNGHLIASRRFKPGEYLNGDLEGMAEMPPQTPIHIALDILDPGPKAVNYSLSFHSPSESLYRFRFDGSFLTPSAAANRW